MLTPGEIVGKYVVEALVGEGGLARVYRVRHKTLRSAHALKVLAVQGGAIQRRLVREGRIQATLDHPHVVAVTDVIEHHGHPGLVMEYIEGLSLDRLLVARGALPIQAVLELMAQVLGAMRAAHSKGVLHRDLKPANVMLQAVSGGARAVVTDFGIARLMVDNGSGDTVQGDFLGTPGYMAPEQVSDPTQVDSRADVYSLGALAYCMICGQPPFQTSQSMINTLQAAASANFPPVLELRPDCPQNVAETIEAALSPDPDSRPVDAKAMGVLLFGSDPELMKVLDGRPGLCSLWFDAGAADVATSPRSQGPISDTAVPVSMSGSTFSWRPGATAVPGDFASVASPSKAPVNLSAQTAGPQDEDAAGSEAPDAPASPRSPDTPAWPVADASSEGASPAPAVQTADSSTQPARSFRPWMAGVAALGLLAASGWWLTTPSAPTPAKRPQRLLSVQDVIVTPAPTPPPTSPTPPGNGEASERTAGQPPGDAQTPAPTRAAPPLPVEPPAPPPQGSPEAESAPSDDEPMPRDATMPDAPSPTPEPTPAEPTPAEPTPAEPPSEDGTADAGLPEAGPEGDPDEPPPPPAWSGPTLTGAWTGRYGGRPLTLRVVRQTDGRVQAELDVLAGGQSWRTFQLSGSVSPDGTLRLKEAGPGWQVTGKATAGNITGQLSHPDLRRPMALKAQRR